MKRQTHRHRPRSPRSEIARLQERLRNERDRYERESIKQHIEHWTRANK